MIKHIFAFLLILGFSLPQAFAADAKEGQGSHALMSPEEQALRNKAKRRIYPGGRDEEPLTVQEELPQAIRKIGPALEVIEDDPADAHD